MPNLRSDAEARSLLADEKEAQWPYVHGHEDGPWAFGKAGKEEVLRCTARTLLGGPELNHPTRRKPLGGPCRQTPEGYGGKTPEKGDFGTRFAAP